MQIRWSETRYYIINYKQLKSNAFWNMSHYENYFKITFSTRDADHDEDKWILTESVAVHSESNLTKQHEILQHTESAH
jgi:hypothetical protein